MNLSRDSVRPLTQGWMLVILAKETADNKALNETYTCKSEGQHLINHSLTSTCRIRIARPEMLARSTADF